MRTAKRITTAPAPAPMPALAAVERPPAAGEEVVLGVVVGLVWNAEVGAAVEAIVEAPSVTGVDVTVSVESTVIVVRASRYTTVVTGTSTVVSDEVV